MELLQRITSRLDDDYDAILSVRLTCKTLEAAIFEDFADKFFKSHEYCIFYKRSLIRLQDLLASSSRLMARMRTVTFTSHFFANMRPKHVKLALNQSETDLLRAQLSAMKAYSQNQLDILPTQILPDAELIRGVLVALAAKCPGVKLNLEIWQNARPSISMHSEVLEAVAFLGTPLASLSVDPNGLQARDLHALKLGLSACTSSLVKFCFANVRPDGFEIETQVLDRSRYCLLHSALGSTNSLRDLVLDFGHHRDTRGILKLTSELLVASSHPMLRSLAVAERTLLKALAIWGGQLQLIHFTVVDLRSIEGEGWSDVLRALTTMPKLRETRLYELYARRNTLARSFVDLRNLKHGQKSSFRSDDRGTHNDVRLRKGEVAAGLQELLAGGLKYH